MKPPAAKYHFVKLSHPISKSMNDAGRCSWRIAVFARNEQLNLRACVQSIIRNLDHCDDLRIHILINGCTDRTADIAEDLKRETMGRVVPVSLPIGDKCNAWNSYVHDHLDTQSPLHFFMDGDVRVWGNSLITMRDAMAGNPDAQAIAAQPSTGRNRQKLVRWMIERNWIYGNLYAVRTSHLMALRDREVRLPLGLVGNDCLITQLLKLVPPDLQQYNGLQIIHHPDARFCFDPLSPWRAVDWGIYRRRSVTNRLRAYQLLEIGTMPIFAIPSTMDAINQRILKNLESRVLVRPLDRMVRARLRKMYPAKIPADGFYQTMLPQAA